MGKNASAYLQKHDIQWSKNRRPGTVKQRASSTPFNRSKTNYALNFAVSSIEVRAQIDEYIKVHITPIQNVVHRLEATSVDMDNAFAFKVRRHRDKQGNYTFKSQYLKKNARLPSIGRGGRVNFFCTVVSTLNH